MKTAAATEAFCSWCSARAESGQRRMKLSMLGTAFFSLAANGFSYMNFTPQHDALIESFWYSRSHLIGLGRFLLNGYGLAVKARDSPAVFMFYAVREELLQDVVENYFAFSAYGKQFAHLRLSYYYGVMSASAWRRLASSTESISGM